MTVRLVEWHTLDEALLSSDSVILDLGANIGSFSRSIRERVGCEVHAVEAAPAIFRELTKVPGVQAHHYAMVGKEGPVQLHLSDNPLAATAMLPVTPANESRAVEVPGIDLESFVRRHAIHRIDLLKVDIEGAEIEMFDACGDETLRGIGQITAEFHDFCGLVAPADVRAVLLRLEKLGFCAVRMSRVGHQDTWLVNRRLHRISRSRLAYVKYVLRNWRGARRLAAKALHGDEWHQHCG